MIYDGIIMMQGLCYFKDKLIHSSSFLALLPAGVNAGLEARVRRHQTWRQSV